MTHILKKCVDVMSTVVETSRIPLLEFPRRFTFSEVAHTRHNSSKLDSALTYSQHCLYRDDIADSTAIILPKNSSCHCGKSYFHYIYALY